MANKTVRLFLGDLEGETGLTVELINPSTGAIGNGAGDSLTEVGNGLFEATVTEAITGWWKVVVKKGTVTYASGGNLYIASDIEGNYDVDDPSIIFDAVNGIELNPVIQVTPYQTLDLSTQVQGTTIRTWLGSKATVGPFAVFDNDGDPVTLNGTYEIVVSKGYRDDIKIIPHGNISIVGNQYSFSVDGATGIVGSHSWAFKLVSTNDPITQGQFIVRQVANKDTL